MIRSLYQFLYGSTPAEFTSAFGLQESIERLRAATKRSVFSALARSAAVGPVKENKVRLQRVIPMVGNSFKPFFVGRFEARADGVYLRGRFTMLPFVKVFTTFWLGMTTVMGIVLGANLRAQSGGVPALLGCCAMTGFGIGLIAVGKWFARNDADWLSNVIRTALGAPAPLEEAATHVALAEQGTPTVLRVVAGVLLLGGVLNLLNFYGDWMPKASATSQFREPFLRAAIGILGVVMIGLATGIHQRKLLAWRLGLVFLAATAGLSVLQMFFFGSFPGPVAVKVVMSVAMLAVYAVWTRWWYAQRVHFFSDDSAWPSKSA